MILEIVTSSLVSVAGGGLGVAIVQAFASRKKTHSETILREAEAEVALSAEGRAWVGHLRDEVARLETRLDNAEDYITRLITALRHAGLEVPPRH